MAKICLAVMLAACGRGGDGPAAPAPRDDAGRFVRADGGPLPDAGLARDASVPAGPEFTGCGHPVFDAFWTAFDRDYALFDLRLAGGSWDALGREACASIDASTAGHELFDVLLRLAQNLDDGHVQITADDLGRDEDAQVSVYPHEAAVEQIETLVEANYLDGELTPAANDSFAWGLIEEVGYLSITGFDELSESGDDEAQDVAAAREAMERAMEELGDASAIIVDIRANGGGWDSAALEVATWFAGERTIAWQEARRAGPEHTDFTEWEPTYVEAAVEGAFDGPVFLLTSGSTFSAAETFALAMRVRDDVTLVGEPTGGHFSDMMDESLPNGWQFTLSGERYRAADGEIYETRGVPPDIPIALDPAALAAGSDAMLEAAIDAAP
jgi:hypothetical protein